MIISNVIPDNGGIVEGEEAGKLLLGFIILHEALDQQLHPQTYDEENLLSSAGIEFNRIDIFFLRSLLTQIY